MSCGVGDIGPFMSPFGIGEWRDDSDELSDLIVNFWSPTIAKYPHYLNIKLPVNNNLQTIHIEDLVTV